MPDQIANMTSARNFQSSDKPFTRTTMSYAGPTRSRATRDAIPSNPGARPPKPRASGLPNHHAPDWQQLAVFGAGLAMGIALGAAVAMLTAPQSGVETRADISRKASRAKRMIGRRSHNAWLDLRDEMRGMTLTLRRRKAKRDAAEPAAEVTI